MDDDNALDQSQTNPLSRQRGSQEFFFRVLRKKWLVVVLVIVVAIWALWFSFTTARGSNSPWLAGLPSQMLFVLMATLSILYYREVGWRRLAGTWAALIILTALMNLLAIDAGFMWVIQAIVVSSLYIKSQLP